MTERAYSGVYTHEYEYAPDMVANVCVHYTRAPYTSATWNSPPEGGEIEIVSLSIDNDDMSETLKGEILTKFQQQFDSDEIFGSDIIDYCFQNTERLSHDYDEN